MFPVPCRLEYSRHLIMYASLSDNGDSLSLVVPDPVPGAHAKVSETSRPSCIWNCWSKLLGLPGFQYKWSLVRKIANPSLARPLWTDPSNLVTSCQKSYLPNRVAPCFFRSNSSSPICTVAGMVRYLSSMPVRKSGSQMSRYRLSAPSIRFPTSSLICIWGLSFWICQERACLKSDSEWNTGLEVRMKSLG